MKKILITGATGLIGRTLCSKLIAGSDEVTVFTRNSESTKIVLPGAKNFIEWNYKKPEECNNYLNGTDVIVHLAGAN